jgi:hypothetical protein
LELKLSEIGELYSEIRNSSRKKRASNRAWSANKLTELGVKYESCNSGAHLIVEGNTSYIDFWPGTGKWISRDGASGRGIKSMLSLIGIFHYDKHC